MLCHTTICKVEQLIGYLQDNVRQVNKEMTNVGIVKTDTKLGIILCSEYW